MSGYELTVGGEKGDSGATTYTDILDLNISENPTAKGSWAVDVPYSRSFEDELMSEVYIYFDNSIIFRGLLESVESSFDDSSTSLSGRGIVVDLEYQVETVSFSNTTAYDALVDYWANNTNFEADVLPPNREFFDETYTATQAIVKIFSYDATKGSSLTRTEHADVDNSELYLEKLNFTEDASTSSMATDTGSDYTDSAYSNDNAIRIESSGSSPDGYVEYSYSPDYDNGNYRWYVRLASSDTNAVLDFYINGTHVRQWDLSDQSVAHQWLDVLNDSRLSTINSAPSSLGTSPTLRVEVGNLDELLSSGEYVDIDAMSTTSETYGSYTLPDSTNADNVYEGPEWHPANTLVDGEPDDSYQARKTSSTTERVWMLVETSKPTDSFKTEMLNRDTGEVVQETVTHSHPRTTHYVDFQFANGAGDEFAQRVFLDGHTGDVQSTSGETTSQTCRRFEIFAPDTSTFVTIDDTEIAGTKFEIVEELCELGKYRFAVTDYKHRDIETFPRDTIADEPFWQINSEQRKLDYSEYANKVTVHGETQDDGTYNTATVSDQDEINAVGKTKPHYEKNPDVTTQAEVDTRAQRLLEELTGERDESGSMEVVPQLLDVGYTYPVSPWSDAFRYGGRVGTNALEFLGPDGAPDRVEWDSGGISETNQLFTFEFLIHPREVKQLGDDEFVTVLSGTRSTTPTYNDFVNLYGDGSVSIGFGQEDHTDPYRGRSVPGVINERETQRLSIVWGNSIDSEGWKVYVDGQLEDTFSPDNMAYAKDLLNEEIAYNLGVDADENNPYDGGIDDVRLWLDEERSQSQIREFGYEDLVGHPDANIENLPYYLRLDDRSDTSTAIIDGGSTYDPPNGTITGATYEASFGRLEEIQYSLGDDGTLSLKFDISGRIDTELVKMRNAVRNNRRNL